MAHGKCVFCESRLGVTTHVEIEHYRPKSIYPDAAFEWSNLFPSCRLCNGAKGDVDHGGLLIKPDEEDPEPYFRVNPATGALESQDGRPKLTRRAAKTIEILRLNRGQLSESRIEKLMTIKLWLESVQRDGLTNDLLRQWDFLIDPRSEYKLVLRQLLTESGNSELAALDRRRFQQREIAPEA